MTLQGSCIDSPFGPVSVEVSDRGVQRVGFDTRAAAGDPDHPLLREAVEQLRAYFDGRQRQFDLPLAAQGTPFQQRVWAALCEIGHGHTCSYGDVALRIGAPRAVRAVGAANGRNPIAIVVPCHRVIGSGGGLTGYAGGLPLKLALLEFEGARLALSGARPAAAARA